MNDSTGNENLNKNLIEAKLKQADEALTVKFQEMHNDIDPFLESMRHNGDREFVILSASLLDDYLERIITASFIKDDKVKSTFRDEHVLQSFYAKINIAYFSGLIPKWLFSDLKLICDIRNKFAHRFLTNLDLSDELITAKIDKLEMRPKTIDGIKASRLKYSIVIMTTASMLKSIESRLSYMKPPNLMDVTKLNEFDYNSLALTKDEIKKTISENLKTGN